MTDLLARAGDLVSNHHAWAGPVIFLLIFVESMALIGAFVPASALMIAIGGLVGAGVLDPVPVLAWGMAGAILGDAISYAIGRAIGPRALRHRVFRRSRPVVARCRLFFRRYGVASIGLGRFLGPARSLTPLFAGAFGMRQVPFQIANVVSAIVWVPVMLAPGYLAGRGLAAQWGGLPPDVGLWVIGGGVLVLGGLAILQRHRREPPTGRRSRRRVSRPG
jgi:membrane protein DedA with SNARE-associated domain